MTTTRRGAGPGRLNLGTLLILIAATCVGLGLARAAWQNQAAIVEDKSDPGLTRRKIETAYTCLACVVNVWAIAMVAVGVRQQRCRVLLRQPGFVACLAITLAIAVAVVFHAPIWIWVRMSGPVRYPLLFNVRAMVNQVVFDGGLGSAVVVAWSLQILAGRWRPEPSWNDRAGRLIGLYGILVPSAQLFWLYQFVFR